MRYLLLFLCLATTFLHAQTQPNILLIIADDLGVDRLNGYFEGQLMATTPTLDSLRAAGLTFTNAAAAPSCAPTRAAIMAGKYGVKTGVLTVPGNLAADGASVFDALAEETAGAYATALIGKWHLTTPATVNAPFAFGMDDYEGYLRGAPADYFAWTRVRNGATFQETEYITTALTNAAAAWMDAQTQPWFLWLAHAAPHSPLHVPPAGTFSVGNPTNNNRRYVAMVEALDFEMGRLFAGMTAEERANTLVIFVGDNGTPNNVLQGYPNGRGKGSLYQGGVRVPLIVSGAGVTRAGEREAALVHVTDLYATILQGARPQVPGEVAEQGRFNSLGFYDLLGEDHATAITRDYNYGEVDNGNEERSGFYVRNDRYKLIDFDAGAQEFYDLAVDSFELNNLLLTALSADLAAVKTDLEAEALAIRTGWSCRDHIRNGEETGVDCGTVACGSCSTATPVTTTADGLTVYPNPVADLLEIRLPEERIQTVEIYGAAGRRLLRQTVNGAPWATVDVRELPAGNALVVLRSRAANGAERLRRRLVSIVR